MLLRAPLSPLFPRVAAHPTSHHENPHAVGALEEPIVLVIPLQAKRIEMHVQCVSQLRILTLGLRTKEHVRCPATAANENSLSIHAEKLRPFWCCLRSHLTNSESKALRIRHSPIRDEHHREILENRRPKLSGPPEFWMRDSQLRELIRSKSHENCVARSNRHRTTKGDSANATTERAANRARGQVLQSSDDSELSRSERIDVTHYFRILNYNISARNEIRRLPQAHVFIRRR